MKERPILMSAPMVRAILNGSKTMTRRVVKLPKWAEPGTLEIDFHDKLMAICRETGCFSDIECPVGISSDRLWVRETFAPHCSSVISNRDVSGLYYRADDETKYETDLSWKPSIFMPRWASRITLEVTGVRVERLQDISEEDAKAEGVDGWGLTAEEISDIQISDENPEMKALAKALGPGRFSPRAEFEMLWSEINGKRPNCAWSDNPFVWVISFRRFSC